MNLTSDQSIVGFRQEVRQFIAGNLPVEVAQRGLRAYHEEKADVI